MAECDQSTVGVVADLQTAQMPSMRPCKAAPRRAKRPAAMATAVDALAAYVQTLAPQ